MNCRFTVKCGEEMCGGIDSYKEEIIRDQCVSGLRCKDMQAKILALGKGLPTLEVVINKAEAEEQSNLAQSKLSKGVKHKAMVEIATLEVDKKLGDKARCTFCGRAGHGTNLDTPHDHTSLQQGGERFYLGPPNNPGLLNKIFPLSEMIFMYMPQCQKMFHLAVKLEGRHLTEKLGWI